MRAWRREERVEHGRVSTLAKPLATILLSSAPDFAGFNLTVLQCFRAFESGWYCPKAPRTTTTYATFRTVLEIARYYVDGVVSADDVRALSVLLRKRDRSEQRKLLSLFSRRLGERRIVPDSCRSLTLPYPERLNLVWTSPQPNVPNHLKPDEIRDILGLIYFRKGDALVSFSYSLPPGLTAMTPTCVESLGGWTFWPAKSTEEQRSMNYRTGAMGISEFVHPADVPPEDMEYLWVGELTTNWDDAGATSQNYTLAAFPFQNTGSIPNSYIS
jgi:hypothetical protein